jgi:hypothetical protein
MMKPDERPGPSGSAAGARSRATPDHPSGPRAGGATPLLFGGAAVTEEMEKELRGAVEAFPQIRFRLAPRAAWMVVPIRPILGLSDAAVLFSRIPHNPSERVSSWAWWNTGVLITPRHTYPDGSICAFETSHGTWFRGEPLTILLDMITLWIVRHIHLRRVGWWPGKQVIHTPQERLYYHQPGELCGCNSALPYEVCHREADKKTVAGSDLSIPRLPRLGATIREFLRGNPV